MSLAIVTTTPEGIVIAADSRQSYRNQKGWFRIGSDSATKIIRLNSRCAATVTGLAFLMHKGVNKNVFQVIEEFKNSIPDIESWRAEKIATSLRKYFIESDWYQAEKNTLIPRITAELAAKGITGVVFKPVQDEEGTLEFQGKDASGNSVSGAIGFEGLQFALAGYQEGGFDVFISFLPGPFQHPRDSANSPTTAFGTSWLGQTDVTTRVVLGHDPRLFNVPFVAEAIKKLGMPIVKQQLQGLEYSVQWGTITLNDGIDFARLLIQTTNAVQRFSDGILADPGDIAGVGGPIDVAVITPEKGFQWVAKKEITV